jgi:hypothetical protein
VSACGKVSLLRTAKCSNLILDENSPRSERCSMVWVGKAGSKKEGELGLEIVWAIGR